ncbi:MAG: zinc ribbon domain-containing protein [Caulobacteraceae bacterium]|nr:zinc ribbon domain-containing protein [Caulobacteraceae bacterium]
MLYHYKCLNCSATLSVERSIHAKESAPSCTDCGKAMNRVWSSPPLSFRGPGFYSTDK